MDAGERAWTQILDRLEDELRTASATVANAEYATDWTTPQRPGPIPAALRARAEGVLREQRRVQRVLARALDATATERRLTEAIVTSVATTSVPRYLDVNA